MPEISIYNNYNGKLFNDNFSHLEPFSHEYKEGVEYELIHRSRCLGIVEIKKIKVVPFNRISEMVAFACYGEPLHYVSAKLSREFNQGRMTPGDKLFMHMILGWATRDFENQTALLQEWWPNKKVI